MKTIVLNFRPSGRYGTEVVGELQYQSHLEYLASFSEDKKLEPVGLYLEDYNKDDSNAVAIDAEGETVGYLSRADAVRYRQAIARLGHPVAIGFCPAKLIGGYQLEDGETANYGVRLDLDLDNLQIENISYAGKDEPEEPAMVRKTPSMPQKKKARNKIPFIPVKGSGCLYYIFVAPFVLVINFYILFFVGGWFALRWTVETPERRKITLIILGALLLLFFMCIAFGMFLNLLESLGVNVR